MRISIQCGDRALEDYRMKQQQLSAVSVLLSSKLETSSDAVGRLKDENFALKGQIMALQTVLMEQKANAVPADAANLLLFEPQMESGVHKKYVNLLTAKCPGICAVFAGSDTEGYRYMIASSCQDVRPLNDRLKKSFPPKAAAAKKWYKAPVLLPGSNYIPCLTAATCLSTARISLHDSAASL